MRHEPVLLNETIELLNLSANKDLIDCTLGDAGHSERILEKTKPNGRLLGIDADPESVLRAKQYLYRYGERVKFVRDNFVNLKEIVKKENFGEVDGVLMDLGWSTPQFAERGRGFSFEKDEPLDMRFDGEQSNKKNAAQILNEYSADELKKIFKNYGEEKFYAAIAEKVVEKRSTRPIIRTGELTEIVLAVYRQKLNSEKEIPWIGGIHPATKVFQALRIETNNELQNLKKVLPEAIELLKTGGRIAIITFHSLEDRIVKHSFQKQKNIRIITKKPVVASENEIDLNPRSRSAKLRVAEKI